jgi:beta-mannosidase
MQYGSIDLGGADWQMKGFLGEDWRLRRSYAADTRDRRLWLPARVPGSVMDDLWHAGEIPNPYFERNSRFAEWAPQRAWVFRKRFTIPEDLRDRRVWLCFDGVDYAAEFYLNGELLGSHLGMFTPVHFEVGDRLVYGGENLVSVAIQPAPDEQSQVGLTSWVRTHKTRMNYGWDFCPRLPHQGIWQGVRLEYGGEVKIAGVWVRPRLSEDFGRAEIEVEVKFDSSLTPYPSPTWVLCNPGGRGEKSRGVIEVEIRRDGEGKVLARGSVPLAVNAPQARIVLGIDSPALWWPNGYGEQALYRAEVRVEVAGEVSDTRVMTFGIRRAEMAANEGCPDGALAYTLVVNGKRIFIQGWNWTPLDVFYGVERPEKLERLLSLAVRANVNLLRVWGGGLIEKEAFYEQCDRLGIFVWQEFIQSSSGVDNIPSADPEFVTMMEREAREIVPQRRNHPSLLVWCGGNELMSPPDVPLDESHPVIARIQAVVNELDPDRSWLPTTPSGPCFGNSLAAISAGPERLHDVHGPWEYQGLAGQMALYNQGACLLHSEFGVEGITNQKALDALISEEHQWPVSLTNPVWQHLGAWWLKEAALVEAFGDLANVRETQRAAQMLQYEGLRYAVEADRRREPRCSGTLPWQFNEPYPMAASTSAVDYFAQPKPAYYAVAQAYEPVHVSARFERHVLAGAEYFNAGVWVSNGTLDAIRGGTVCARVVGANGQVYAAERWTFETLANGCREMGSIALDRQSCMEPLFFLDLTITGGNRSVLSTNRYLFSWTEDFRPLRQAAPAQVQASLQRDGRRWSVRVENISDTSAFYLWLEDERPAGSPGFVSLNHNYFCILPGEQRTIKALWDDVVPAERVIRLAGWNTNVVHLR